MQQQVWKFLLTPGEQEIEMPDGAQLLSVELSANGPALFALVEPEAVKVTRAFVVVGNGEDLPEGVSALHYRGTAKVPGNYSAHVFETTQNEVPA